MFKERTVKLALNLNARLITLTGKHLTQIRRDCRAFSKKPPYTIGIFLGIYIENYYALKITYKKHAITLILTLIFNDWVNSLMQARGTLSRQELEMLLNHVYIVVCDGNAHLSFEPTAKAILFALLHQIEPEIAPLLCNE